MLLFGLTGGVATGKSTVAHLINEYGVPVLDADLAYWEVTRPDSPLMKKIVEKFGPEVLKEDGSLNRPVLSSIVFNDEEKRKILNSVTHPAVQWQLLKELAKQFFAGSRVVVLDIPLLFETSSMLWLMSKVFCVTCQPDQELTRLMERNTLTEEAAKARIAAQMPLEEKCRRSDVVIDNSQDLDYLRDQVKAVVEVHLRPTWSQAHRGLLKLMLAIFALWGFFYFSQ